MGFPGGSVVKNSPAIQEMQGARVHSLGWGDPLEEGMATCSSILAWESQGQRSLVGYSPQGRTDTAKDNSTKVTELTCTRDTL